MTAFHQQSFQARFGAMGDESEAVFDSIFPKHHRLGLNRPPFSMSGMPANERYVPDRQTRYGMVEIMGIGRDQLLKLKEEKSAALEAWASVSRVEIFVYDSKCKRYWLAPLSDWLGRLHSFGERGEFADGKSYIALAVKNFPTEPIDYVQPADIPIRPSSSTLD